MTDRLAAMILKQHDGTLTAEMRLARAERVAKREMDRWTETWWRIRKERMSRARSDEGKGSAGD